jgi:hypothetical protein
MENINIMELPGQFSTFIIYTMGAFVLALGAIAIARYAAKAGWLAALLVGLGMMVLAFVIYALPSTPQAVGNFLQALSGVDSQFQQTPVNQAPPAGG